MPNFEREKKNTKFINQSMLASNMNFNRQNFFTWHLRYQIKCQTKYRNDRSMLNTTTFSISLLSH